MPPGITSQFTGALPPVAKLRLYESSDFSITPSSFAGTSALNHLSPLSMARGFCGLDSRARACVSHFGSASAASAEPHTDNTSTQATGLNIQTPSERDAPRASL